MVRLEEAREAARLIRVAAGRTPDGRARVPLPPLAAGGHALGLVEAWRGPVWHWVVADGPATLRRVKIPDPSVRNLPGLRDPGPKDNVAAFPPFYHSLNLSS